MDGIINVNKEKGYTSHDVVSIIKRLPGAKKAGHAGTLDPEAEGVLIALVGKATKLSDYLMAGDKEYRAHVKFGVSTSTYDHTGEIVAEGAVRFTETELRNTVSEFVGEQEQIPPMYSAIKVGGRKLYDLARKGIETERAARSIVINDIFVEQFNGFNEATIYIKCGKGVYIRSICHDLGQRLGCGAHMTALTRTKSGPFGIDTAHRLEEIKKGLDGVIIGMDKALDSYNKITVRSQADKLLYNGAKIKHEFLLNPVKIDRLNVLYDESGRIAGIYEESDGYLKPRTMLL